MPNDSEEHANNSHSAAASNKSYDQIQFLYTWSLHVYFQAGKESQPNKSQDLQMIPVLFI